MPARTYPTPLGPEAPTGEIFLAETAIRIELPPSLHRNAIERSDAMLKHIEREDSPLRNLVVYFYPQGSMAIRATIKARRRDDGYDIDIVAELDLPIDTPPSKVLDLLFEAINGPPGSQYHGKVKRQTRCVTIYYADDMHIDVTPSILLDPEDERKSRIFHAKPEEPADKHFAKTMNSWAFCDHVIANTPADLAFVEAYRKRVQVHDRSPMAKDADVKPVPAHATEEGGKSAVIVAHQLMKRNRNVRYQDRSDIRMPPSVMMAAVAVDVDVSGGSISEASFAITNALLRLLEDAERDGKLVDVANPKCAEDSFTDRWPENHEAQRLYIRDMKLFRRQLTELMSGDLDLEEQRDLLSEMFGEGPAQAVVKDYAARLGDAVRTGARRNLSSGRVAPASLSAASVFAPSIAHAHTFYGGKWDGDEND
jgi:Second Messenger Oligonucleotide or Dinucleotide Synthetase domain